MLFALASARLHSGDCHAVATSGAHVCVIIGSLRYTFPSEDVFVSFIFVFAMPTPEASLGDQRFTSESFIVFWLMVNAKESTASNKDGLPCSRNRLTTSYDGLH